MNVKWDRRFLELASNVAAWSKDPSTQVGCEIKYLMVQHAEANAILNAVGNVAGTTAYVTHHPCASCAGLLIQAGVHRIVTNRPSGGIAERFTDSFNAARVMLEEAGVALDMEGADYGK